MFYMYFMKQLFVLFSSFFRVSAVFEAFCEFRLAYGAYLNGFLDFCDYFTRLGSESQVILNMATPVCRINSVYMIFSTVVVFLYCIQVASHKLLGESIQ